MLTGAGACLAPAFAHAAEARYRLAIPPKTYTDALIDLGLQANVTLVGAQACGGGGRVGLAGTYSLDEALGRLLAGAPCSYRIVDPRSVRIVAAAPAAAPREPIRQTFVAEVVVTATKRPANLGSLAADVSVLSRNQIEVTGATDVSATTTQLAGVLTTNLGPARDKLLIRGVSDGAFTGRTRSTVSTYLDETPINYNAPDPDLRLVDVDRIEVVRGPQGALYGSGSISGLYRIVTAKPELERFLGGGAVTAATTEGGSGSYAVEAYLNVPLAPGRAGARLVAYHDDQGGYLDNVSLKASNVDTTVRDGGRAALRLRVNDDWRLDLTAVGQRLRTNDTHYTVAGAGAGQRTNRINEAHKNDFIYGAAALNGELGWGSLSASLAYVHHTFSSQFDASAQVGLFGGRPTDLGLYLEKSRVSMVVGDLVLRSSRIGRFDWLAGLYGASTLEKSPSRLDIAPSGAAPPMSGKDPHRPLYLLPPQGLGADDPGLQTVYDEGRRTRLAEAAVYAEASYDIAPAWTVSAGGRLFQTKVDTFAAIGGLPPTDPRTVSRDQRFTGFLPKLSLQREIGEAGLVYGLYSEGFRPGGFNTSGFLQIRPSRQVFRPDRLRNFELGAKLRFLDHRLGVRAAAYYDQWTDIQTDQYRPSGLSYTDNVGDARILGLEAEVGYDWDFGLSLQANGLLSSSEMTAKNPEFASVIAGRPGQVIDHLPGVPDVSGGVLALYQRPLRHGLSLRLTGEASYVGSSAVSFDATLAARQGRYLRARLAAELASARWTAGVFVTNPGDDATDTFAYGNPFRFSGDARVRQATPQRPRTLGLRLAATF